MNLKSIKLKWIIVSAAGLLFAGVAAVVIFIAVQMGLSWPVVHRVDQGSLPDTIYVKAEDFINDSGYVISASFHSCCSDNAICSWTQTETEVFHLTRANNFVSVPMHWPKRTICSYKFYALYLEIPTGQGYYSFSADSTKAPFPKLINANCLRIEQEDSAQYSPSEQEKFAKCPSGQFALPHASDTLVIRSIQL